MESKAEGPAHARLAAAPPGAVHDGNEAARTALAPLTFGEAPRIGVLGDSGCGKTHAMREIIAMYLAMCPGIVLVGDTKGEPQAQFAGQVRKSVADLRSNPPDPKGPRVIVFHDDPFGVSGGVDLEEIARFAWALAQQKRPSLVVYDELDKACNNGQWAAGKNSVIAWCFGKGRSVGVASLWGTQETQAVPREAFNQSSTILQFRTMGAPLRLLGERGYLEGGAEKVIPSLPGDDVPPAERGVFVALRRGKPFDGKLYKFRRG
jgi:hypothetical protein